MKNPWWPSSTCQVRWVTNAAAQSNCPPSINDRAAFSLNRSSGTQQPVRDLIHDASARKVRGRPAQNLSHAMPQATIRLQNWAKPVEATGRPSKILAVDKPGCQNRLPRD
ncbi:hypothetical protein BDFG_03939 [Blastomyces dermatitidis ATCC 26199]|nr:hypothetical protein BDFG_03939 [Blastomyces dermatitidis ATCC 26199]